MIIKNVLITLLLSLLLLCGCVSLSTTEPNSPFTGPYPPEFEIIKSNNRLLADEIGKLPEIVDGINDEERFGIIRIAKLYGRNPVKFDMVFNRMNSVGKAHIRKFCTPLQAFFWLAIDKKVTDLNPFIENYSLINTLKNAWAHLNKFTKIKGWDDFDTVVERLNAPQLIDYYERYIITYRYRPGHGDSLFEAKTVFKNKSGHCAQITAFTVFCLRKAGYSAEKFIVDEPSLRSPDGNKHRVTLFKVNGREYIMDNGRRAPQFGIKRFQDYSPNLRAYNRNLLKVWEELEE